MAFRNTLFRNLLLLILLPLALSLSAQRLLKNVGQYEIAGMAFEGPSNPIHFTALNDDQFVFQAVGSPLDTGRLFVSDGSETGTRKVGTVTPDGPFVRFRDRLFFYGSDVRDQLVIGLWATDGTDGGTELIFESNPTTSSFPFELSDFHVLDTLLLFSGSTPSHGTELWRTNGTAAGTRLILDVDPTGSGFQGGEPAVIDTVLYFTGYTPETGLEPWRTDGTPEGTWMIADLNDGPSGSGAAAYTASGGYIYFTGLEAGSGREVRRMTSERNGPIELIGENGGSTDSSNPRFFVDSDGTLFYVAQAGGADGFELLSYNHTGEPVILGPTDIFPQLLKPFGDGRIVFKAKDDGGRELWMSDGTQEGTRRITDNYPGERDGVFPNVSAESFHVYKDSLVFYAGADGVAAAGEFVTELFVTDGTEAGTRLIADQGPGTEGSSPGNFFTFNDRIYFAATDPDVDREPFYLGPEDLVVSLREPGLPGLMLTSKPYPNPARAGQSIQFEMQLTRALKFAAGLYDQRGRVVQELPLPLGIMAPGSHVVPVHLPSNLATGPYFLRLRGESGVLTFRLVIVE